MFPERTSAIILAAGLGTRMKSSLPKVLHLACGRPLVHYPVQAALDAGAMEVVVVVGHGRDAVQSYLQSAFSAYRSPTSGEPRVKTTVQEEQRGTGHAAEIGLRAVSDNAAHVIVFYGDVPLIMAQDLAHVAMGGAAPASPLSSSGLSLATCVVDDPTGYGRIVRRDGRICGIREQKDASPEERAITEINPGIYCASRAFLAKALASLTPNNAQKELYLTDIVDIAVREGVVVTGVPSSANVLIGVNDRAQLADVEAGMHARIMLRHRRAGVTVREGARIDDTVTIEPDATIEANVVLRGTTSIGKSTLIDVGSVLTNATIADAVTVKPYSVIANSKVAARAQIGPFSHLRPDTVVDEDAHLGNFVETKKTHMGKGSKANHLAYLGDGIVGEGSNVGAGTIFCNYDGFKKHTTTIGKNVFVGSDSQIVAPVTLGDGSYVATGTTVTRDVPADALAIGRTKQENKEGYASKLRARLKPST